MPDLKEKSMALVASVASVNLNSVATTNLFTVPADKVFVPSHVIIRDLSADAASTVCTFGQTGAKTDFLGSQTLSNLSAAGKAGILQPIPNATTVVIVEYTEAEIFCIDVTTGAGGACTCTVDVYGTLSDE